MTKANPKLILSNRTYTVPEAAAALGMCTTAIRRWIARGLPILDNHGPALIRGEDMKHYIAQREARRRFTIALDELLCTTCKVGRKPLGMMVDYTQHHGKTGRLSGLCEACGGPCNRMIASARLPDFQQIFDLVIRGM
jgi:hypothetical protein